MEENVEAASKAVALAETHLRTSLASNEPSYTGLEYQLAKYRDACVNFIFLDWRAAASRDVETRLWNDHGLVNSKFRPYLASFREGDGKKKHVERRKAEKLYLDFIKSSMRFYRGFIQRLASHFKNVPEVFEIARKFSLDTLSANSPIPVDLEMKLLILQSCHATLIHLGDLSRYRETELNQKERNWGPAKGYYDIATALDPADGMSFNQLAVISLADNNHLLAVYYLYRALCIQKPPPQTLGNLETEFKKVLKHKQRGKPLFPIELPGISNSLVTAFLTYHAACYTDFEFSDDEDQRKALLAQFATEVKTKPFDSAFRKMCLINIMASKQVEEQLHGLGADETTSIKLRTRFAKTQGLNVATYQVLLDLVSEELRIVKHDNAQVSPCTRRLLPLLRVYNGWLLSNVHFVLESPLIADVASFWTAYAKGLSLLISAFPIRDLPEVTYLLDEDQDTVTCTAFSLLARKLHFEEPTGSIKPSRTDAGSPEAVSPEQEMLFRIKEIAIVGVHLVQHKNDFGKVPVPLDFGGMQFHCTMDDPMDPRSQQPEPPSILAEQPNGFDHADGSGQTTRALVTGINPSNLLRSENDPIRSSTSQPQSPSPKISTKGGSRPSSSTFTAQDLVRQMKQPSPVGHIAHRTSLPTIFPTPFTPRPGETFGSGSGSRPSTAHQVLPPNTAPVPPSRGTIEFQQQLAQMQHNIQARTSPIASLDPTSSSYYETPTGLNTFIRNQPDSSPWERSMTTPSNVETQVEIPRMAPQASPFGAIGEPRPRIAKTPTSVQPG